MADIKAKDISVAQSIASSDLILGSSIAGTTANVKVETVGNFILNNFPKSDLGNQSILPYVKNIQNKIKRVSIISKNYNSPEPNVYSNVDSFTLNAPTLLYIKYAWSSAQPLGIAITNSPAPSGGHNELTPIIKAEYSNLLPNSIAGAIFVTGFIENPGTYYVFIKAASSQPSKVVIEKLIEF
jgi:hypothetical protein